MRIFTFQLFQFSICVLIVTVLFRYVLNIFIGLNGWFLSVLCSIVYFGLMFLIGWYFGKKDEIENGIHDIGFRFHSITYIICIGVSYLSDYIGWNTESFKSITVTTLCWGGILLVHFILFLLEQRKTIKGYSKDDIFE